MRRNGPLNENQEDEVVSHRPSADSLRGSVSFTGSRSSSIMEVEEEDEVPPTICMTYLFLIIFLAGQILVNFDNGAIIPAIIQIRNEFNVGFEFLGFFGAIGYLGLAMSTFLWGFRLQTATPRRLLGKILFLNACSTTLLASASPFRALTGWRAFSFVIAFIARFFVGFSQAGFVIFAPIWVDHFAPAGYSTLWLGLSQAFTAIGILLGFASTGFTINAEQGQGPNPPVANWSYAIYAQSVLLLGLAALIYWSPGKYTNIKPALAPNQSLPIGDGDDLTVKVGEAPPPPPALLGSVERKLSHLLSFKPSMGLLSEPETPDSQTDVRFGLPPSSKRRQILSVLVTADWWFLVSTISALLFVASGLQFWIVTYLNSQFGCKNDAKGKQVPVGCVTRDMINLHFIIVMITSPIIGVVVGSLIFDLKIIGGYQNLRARFRSSVLLVFLATVCVTFAILVPLENRYRLVIFYVWVVLFFGGSMLAALTGLILYTVPQELRSLSSSLMQLFTNIFGFAASNLIPGLVVGNPQAVLSIQAAGGNTKLTTSELRPAVEIIMAWSIFGLALTLIFCYRFRRALITAQTKSLRDNSQPI